QGDARGEGGGFPGDGGQFPVGDAGHDLHGGGDPEDAALGADFDQAKSFAPGHGAGGADSSVPRADGDRHAGERAAVRFDREFDGRGGDVAGDSEAGVGAFDVGGGDRVRVGGADAG